MSHLVSVIIPVRNMARYLPDAISSIPNVHEILIVAADSNDATNRIANELTGQRPELRVMTNPERIPAAARNIGVREATGDVIAFNDADDLWPQGRLALQLERLDREPRADLVSGLITCFRDLDSNALESAPSFRSQAFFVPSVVSTIFRRSVFDRIGLFDETLTYGEDTDLFMRVMESEVPFVILNTPTLYYRRHPDSLMARNDSRRQSDLIRLVSLSLARRRRLGLSLAPISFESYREDVCG